MGQKTQLHFNLQNAWILLLGVILAFSVFLFRWAPWQARVESVSPANGKETGGNLRIAIQFKQAMQTDSVLAHFEITPQRSGHAEWVGNTFTWIPDSSLPEGVDVVTAHLSAGSMAVDGRVLQKDLIWTFRVRPPEVAFLSPGAKGGNEIWAASLNGEEPRKITDTGGTVQNFAPAPNGDWLLFARQNGKAGSDLWRVRRDGSNLEKLVNCGSDRCTWPAWAPDGSRAAFTREKAGEKGTFDVPKLWMVDLSTHKAKPYYPSDYPMQGAEPSWSPNGRYVAALDASIGGIRITDLQGSEDALLQTTLERVGQWSLDGNRMVFAEEGVVNGNYGIRLLLMDLVKRKVDAFLPEEFDQADDSTPYFSPDGISIAVSRRLPGGPVTRQVWVMGVDGSHKVQLTSDETTTYTVMGWDVWGRRILFQRAQLGSSDVKPEVGFVDVGTGQVAVLGENASQPAWLY